MKYDVFISYSRKDFEEVNRLRIALLERIPELKIWFDIDGIESGDEFEDKIISAIDESAYVLFALSDNSIASQWTKDEVMYAKNTEKRVVPILLKGATLKGWFLFRFGRVDCIDSTNDLQMQKLLQNISNWCGKNLRKGYEKENPIVVERLADNVPSLLESNVEKCISVNEIEEHRWDPEYGKITSIPFESVIKGVHSAVFSPDGSRIITASRKHKTMRIWDANTGKRIGSILKGHNAGIFYVAFSADGKQIFSASYDSTVRIWDATTGRQIDSPIICPAGKSIDEIAFSPDGKRIVMSLYNPKLYNSTLHIWDAVTGKRGPQLKGENERVMCFAFSPDGKRIVSASLYGTLRVWDAETGQQIGDPLVGHTLCINSVVFSPDGNRIVSASYDYTVRIWSIITNKQIGDSFSRNTVIWDASFSHDGRLIVSAGNDKTLILWDTHTRKQIGTPLVGHNDIVYSVAFSPDSRRIISTSKDGTVRIWEWKPF